MDSTEHTDLHEEQILARLYAESPNPVEIADAAARCDECVSYLFRLAEVTVALDGAVDRMAGALDEAIVWLAARDDAKAARERERERER